MKLTYFEGHVPNFGDELNPYLWEKLLPKGFLDDNSDELFLGIGSIIWDNLPKKAIKHVIGSGYGAYTALPDVHDGSWNVVFVRGPRTAAALKLPKEKAICDSALLLRHIALPDPTEKIDVAFIPHYQSFDRGLWIEACKMAGIKLIDPRDPVEKVISEIKAAKVTICEAMHGAIVSDALRTPWIAVRPIHALNRTKWLDWAEGMSIDLRMHNLQPSSALELYLTVSKRERDFGPRALRMHQSSWLSAPNQVLSYLAARNLTKIGKMEPQLSRDNVVESVAHKALEALEKFVSIRDKSRIHA
jgi:succinoglycan biosynthesis protein ExoV